MQRHHMRAAVAAVAAPFTLAVFLAGIRADAKPVVLDRLSLEVPWLVTIPVVATSAPAAPSATPAKSAAPAPKPAQATAQPEETSPDAGLLQCCAALHARGQTAREDARAAYSSAARTCDAVAASPKAREAIGQLRGHLEGAELPLECR